MLKNYLRISFRTIFRHKVFSLINVLGFAFGMTCFILIFLSLITDTTAVFDGQAGIWVVCFYPYIYIALQYLQSYIFLIIYISQLSAVLYTIYALLFLYFHLLFFFLQNEGASHYIHIPFFSSFDYVIFFFKSSSNASCEQDAANESIDA